MGTLSLLRSADGFNAPPGDALEISGSGVRPNAAVQTHVQQPSLRRTSGTSLRDSSDPLGAGVGVRKFGAGARAGSTKTHPLAIVHTSTVLGKRFLCNSDKNDLFFQRNAL